MMAPPARPMPLRMQCTSLRILSPVIQRDTPVRVAMRPSRVEASLSITKGLFCSSQVR